MTPQHPHRAPKLTIITPAYNESANLPLLYNELKRLGDLDWEWLVIDDGSTDDTVRVLREIGESDPRLSWLRLARNSGSHVAALCGLEHASGNCAVIMAADLQDPPDIIPELISHWEKGWQVVWCVREQREGTSLISLLLSRAYYFIMRNFASMRHLPAQGADFFLVDRVVLEGLKRFKETNLNIVNLIAWMGFRQTEISYTKAARQQGVSKWSFTKRVKLMFDSIVGYSFFPIRWLTISGVVIAFSGLAFAARLIAVHWGTSGSRPLGWTSLMVVTLVLGGMQMLMLGMLREYLWRTLEETRSRPRFLIESGSNGALSRLAQSRR